MISFKYYKSGLLITVIIVLAACFDFAMLNWIVPLFDKFNIEIIRAPGNAALIVAVLSLYDKYLWKYRFLKHLVKIPDMSGRYKGELHWTFKGEEGMTSCFIEISQTASKIKVNSYFKTDGKPDTSSKSLVENIVEAEGFYTIYLYYLNSGSKNSNELDCHEGANSLKFIPAYEDQPTKLEGYYFTNRKIQTRGIMKAQLITKKRKGTY